MTTTLMRMADADFYVVTTGPTCHHLCDGTGWTRDPDPDDRIPVPCLVHRPDTARRVAAIRANRRGLRYGRHDANPTSRE
jgi:hypothetical protein